MRKLLMALCLTCVLMPTHNAMAQDEKQPYGKVPERARQLVAQGLELALRDKIDQAVASLKEAIAIAPNYVNAHAQYIWVKANFLGRYDEVKAEYEALMSKEPRNPVYPLAFAIGQGQTQNTQPFYEKVVALAPEWAWAHYARAIVASENDPVTAVAELQKYIEKDGSWLAAYNILLYIQEKRLGKIDDAIATAERMAAHAEFRAPGLSALWRLRLAKAQGSEQAKQSLRDELTRLTSSTRDVKILEAIRSAYTGLLEDKQSADGIESKLGGIDSTWYAERGSIVFVASSNLSGISRMNPVVNRQVSILWKVFEIKDELESKEKIARFEALLSLNPGVEMRRYIYEKIIKEAEKSKNTAAIIRHGESLYSLDRSDVALLSKLSVALADEKKDLANALKYAKQADDATAEFRPLQRPDNNDAEAFKKNYTPERQRKIHTRMRALALEAYGWALYEMNNYSEAEIKLKEAVAVGRSESNLSHLAEVLGSLGRKEEAEKIAAEAKREYAESIKRQFISQPAKDFELQTIDGRTVKLSDLKGKVVMLDFWTTWCGPCARAIPHLARMYEKYRDQGFEILAISCDDKTDRHKVAPYAVEHKLAYCVLYDADARTLYNVQGYPTSIFIDRQGNVRYRDIGFGDESARKLEVIISELLK